MALQLGNLRDALIEAGASEEKARLASEEVAAYENRLVSIGKQLAELRAYVDRRFAELQAELGLVRAELSAELGGLRREFRLLGGFIIALLVPILVKLFVHG